MHQIEKTKIIPPGEPEDLPDHMWTPEEVTLREELDKAERMTRKMEGGIRKLNDGEKLSMVKN